MAVKFQLSTADRQKYGAPDWVDFDADVLASQFDYDTQAEWERETRADAGVSIALILAREWPGVTMLGVRGIVWLALKMQGSTVKFKDFKPNCLGVDWEHIKDADAGPPAKASSPPRLAAKRQRSKKA